jgi:hypothetical protein
MMVLLDVWSVLVKRNCSTIEKLELSHRMLYTLHQGPYYTQHISTQF